MDPAFVFGYGSLLGARRRRAVRGWPGHRRRWAVAMDNRRTIPGYKYFLDADGARPDVYVTFLDAVAGARARRVDGLRSACPRPRSASSTRASATTGAST